LAQFLIPHRNSIRIHERPTKKRKAASLLGGALQTVLVGRKLGECQARWLCWPLRSPWRFSLSGSLKREACDPGALLPDGKMMSRCWRKSNRWRLWKMLRPWRVPHPKRKGRASHTRFRMARRAQPHDSVTRRVARAGQALPLRRMRRSDGRSASVVRETGRASMKGVSGFQDSLDRSAIAWDFGRCRGGRRRGPCRYGRYVRNSSVARPGRYDGVCN